MLTPPNPLGSRDGSPSKQIEQSLRVVWRRALVIVIEIHEYGAPLSLPFGDMARPDGERSVGIIVPVATSRTMSAYINVVGRELPWRWRVMMIGQAKRDVVRAQKPENVIVVPALVAKL